MQHIQSAGQAREAPLQVECLGGQPLLKMTNVPVIATASDSSMAAQERAATISPISALGLKQLTRRSLTRNSSRQIRYRRRQRRTANPAASGR
jgi:hypothetical protein